MNERRVTWNQHINKWHDLQHGLKYHLLSNVWRSEAVACVYSIHAFSIARQAQPKKIKCTNERHSSFDCEYISLVFVFWPMDTNWLPFSCYVSVLLVQWYGSSKYVYFHSQRLWWLCQRTAKIKKYVDAAAQTYKDKHIFEKARTPKIHYVSPSKRKWWNGLEQMA